MKKTLLAVVSALFILAFSSCEEIPTPGCTDPNSVDYNPNADEDNGSCRYRYASNVKVNNFPANNSSGNPWDLLDGPDMYLVFAKATSNTWDYSTVTSQDVQNFTTLTNTSTNIRFSNESWKYELRDDDGSGTYEVMSSGTFNPLQDQQASEITLSTGATTIYFQFTVH